MTSARLQTFRGTGRPRTVQEPISSVGLMNSKDPPPRIDIHIPTTRKRIRTDIPTTAIHGGTSRCRAARSEKNPEVVEKSDKAALTGQDRGPVKKVDRSSLNPRSVYPYRVPSRSRQPRTREAVPIRNVGSGSGAHLAEWSPGGGSWTTVAGAAPTLN